MKKDKLTYYQEQIRIWLFKAMLVFCALSFSGINLQVHSQANAVVRTELTESRIRKPAYELDKYISILSPITSKDVQTFNIWTLLYHYNVIRSKFKSYHNRILLYGISTIDFRIKIPPLPFKAYSPFFIS